MSPRRRNLALLSLLLSLPACAASDLSEELDEAGDLAPGHEAGASAGSLAASVVDREDPSDEGPEEPYVPGDTGGEEGCGSALAVDPAILDFGDREVGTFNQLSAVLTNTCDAPVRLFINAQLPDDFGWLISSCTELADDLLGAGDSCDLLVRFNPSEFFIGYDPEWAQLEVTASDPTTDAVVDELVVPIRGRVVAND